MRCLHWSAAAVCICSLTAHAQEPPSVRVGAFPQEVSRQFASGGGAPAAPTCLAVAPDGRLYAGGASGLWRIDPASDGPAWERVAASPEGIELVVATEAGPACVAKGRLHRPGRDAATPIPGAMRGAEATFLTAVGRGYYLGTTEGVFAIVEDAFFPVDEINRVIGPGNTPLSYAAGPEGQEAVGADRGLYILEAGEGWVQVYPEDEARRWAPANVRGVAFDSAGRLWFASDQGAGRYDGEWALFEGADGLPWNGFTGIAAGPDGAVWFATDRGAIRYEDGEFRYRQGRRWVPGDHVHDVAVDGRGNAWLATDGGMGAIRFRSMTLMDKARHYENLIDRYNRRTEFGYVLAARLAQPGDLSEWTNHDSDNDGLWTSIYGAGQCYAYGATKNPSFKERARNAFRALAFLSEVTQGGERPAQEGFVARTVVPTTEPDPNLREAYTLEGQQARQAGDRLWRAYTPRWPRSETGEYYWKSDTSSDELDGHYYFYPLYYDLVCETEAEKAEVREVVRRITDHLIRNDWFMVDWTGEHTRWAVYNPELLNTDIDWWWERGLKSLSALSYLAVAEHITGDAKYAEEAERLREAHFYHQNLMVPKIHWGIGTGNQSDDEMAFMCFYNLLKYTDDPALKNRYLLSFYDYWRMEEPELNPWFNFLYAAVGLGEEHEYAFGTHSVSPWEGWLADSVETLKRFPLDRVNWRHTNSHRLDIERLTRHFTDPTEPADHAGKGWRVDHEVIPVDECHFNHWNRDPWRLDTGGDGRRLSDGAVYLTPYYMGLYYGFIEQD